jgi:Tfp pilus assembly protein PilV
VRKGQSLFEVVFALGVIGIVMVGIVALATTSIRNASFSRNQSVATRYMQEGVEWLREQRDLDWDTFRSYAGNTWCLNGSPLASWGAAGGCGGGTISGTIFTREVALSQISVTPPIIEADVTVVWQDAQGLHDARTVTRLTSWPTQ